MRTQLKKATTLAGLSECTCVAVVRTMLQMLRWDQRSSDHQQLTTHTHIQHQLYDKRQAITSSTVRIPLSHTDNRLTALCLGQPE